MGPIKVDRDKDTAVGRGGVDYHFVLRCCQRDTKTSDGTLADSTLYFWRTSGLGVQCLDGKARTEDRSSRTNR